MNTSPEKQGDDVFGSVGPHTTLCEFADPDDCSESHFDSGTSAHIGDHEYAGSADPWAIYQVVLPQKPSCIDEDNLRLVLRYQLNDVWHGHGTDHDAYIKLRDWGEAEETYDLLDSTVNEEESSGIQGTLDGSNESGHFDHGTLFFIGSTRYFSKTSISDTSVGLSETGVYLQENGSSQSKIQVRISTNPGGGGWGPLEHTRIEVDWLKIQYFDETVEPTNPSNPTFHWEQSSMPGGPTTSGWYNSLGSEVEVRFTSGGSDDCQFSNIEYMWLEIDSNPPTSFSSGTVSYPDDTTNSVFSQIPVPTDSGAFKFWYRAVDSFGNKAQWVSTDSIDFDFTNPQLPTIPTDSSWYNEEDYIALNWLPATDTFSGMFKYNISQTGVGSIGSVDHDPDTELFTFELHTELLNPGVNQFQITAMDETQPSPNSQSKTVEIQYDPFAPVVSLPIIEGEKFTSSGPKLEWFHPLAFERIIEESGVFSCQLTIDGTEVSYIPVSNCTSDSGSVTLPVLEDGNHNLTITACDHAGNCGTGGVRNFTVDATSPSIAWSEIIPSGDQWFSQKSLSVSANFSDTSAWGEGSGIDRIWHGIYLEGETPSISELKVDYPGASICEGICESHELNRNFPVQDGTWVWHYVVRDKAGSETFGSSSSITKIDNTEPYFVEGPSLEFTTDGILEATWDAVDDGSGVYGYLFEIDSCDFTSLTPTVETSFSFEPTANSHFICVRIIDRAGNEFERIIDSADPSIECPTLSSEGGIENLPPTVTCYIFDNSAINLHDGHGSIEWIFLDGKDITSTYYWTDEENAFSFDVNPMEIGNHRIEIRGLDQYGRTFDYILGFRINGEGIKVELVDGSYLHSEESLNFHWDKIELNQFFGQQFLILGVNIHSLNADNLTEYFDVNSYNHENPLFQRITLDFKPSAIPKLGESTTLTFTIDDTYNSVEYNIQINVDNCPSTHIHNRTSDTCEIAQESAQTNQIPSLEILASLFLVSVIIAVVFQIRRR